LLSETLKDSADVRCRESLLHWFQLFKPLVSNHHRCADGRGSSVDLALNPKSTRLFQGRRYPTRTKALAANHKRDDPRSKILPVGAHCSRRLEHAGDCTCDCWGWYPFPSRRGVWRSRGTRHPRSPSHCHFSSRPRRRFWHDPQEPYRTDHPGRWRQSDTSAHPKQTPPCDAYSRTVASS
jgi:hypothetical protein